MYILDTVDVPLPIITFWPMIWEKYAMLVWVDVAWERKKNTGKTARKETKWRKRIVQKS